MGNLYPARRIPQHMILIGIMFVALALATAVGHWGFGVPVYDRNTGQRSSEQVVVILVLAFAGVGLLLALAGRALLETASRHNSKRPINENDS